MPNFHTNCLAITANEKDMFTVLKTLAQNLFLPLESGSRIDPALYTMPEQLFIDICPYLEGQYALAFSSGGTVKQPLSEDATVTLERFDKSYGLSMSFDTARRSCADVIYEFVRKLPRGSYGFSFADAGETLGYDFMKVRYELTPHPFHATADELFQLSEDLCQSDLSQEKDLNKLAVALVASHWPSYTDGLSALKNVRPYNRAKRLEALRTVSLKTNATNYHLVSEETGTGRRSTVGQRANTFNKTVFEVLQLFPFECEVTGQRYEGRNDNIEHLIPGATVRLQSDWSSKYFNAVGIEIFDLEGRTLGYVGGTFNPSDDERKALACLLPHIRATAVDVAPLSSVDKRKKIARFTIHMELEQFDYQGLRAEVREILGQRKVDRTRTSIVEEG